MVAAAIPINTELRQRFLVTQPYFKIPARFAVRKDRSEPDPQGKNLQGRTIAVLSGTAHEAFANAFLSRATVKPFGERSAAEAALKKGEVDYLFAEGSVSPYGSAAARRPIAAPSSTVRIWRAGFSAKASVSWSARTTTLAPGARLRAAATLGRRKVCGTVSAVLSGEPVLDSHASLAGSVSLKTAMTQEVSSH